MILNNHKTRLSNKRRRCTDPCGMEISDESVAKRRRMEAICTSIEQMDIEPPKRRNMLNKNCTKPSLQIFVKTMGGKTVTVSCGSDDSILYLKTVINDKEGIPTMGQRLLWGGKELQNQYTLRF